jgi:hypothetical protein
MGAAQRKVGRQDAQAHTGHYRLNKNNQVGDNLPRLEARPGAEALAPEAPDDRQILIALTSHGQLGATGRPIGF